MDGALCLNSGPMLRSGRAGSKTATACLLLLSTFAAQAPACVESHPTVALGTQACMDDVGDAGIVVVGATNCAEGKAFLLTFYETRNGYPGGWSPLFTEAILSSPGNELMLATGIIKTFFFLGKFSSEQD